MKSKRWLFLAAGLIATAGVLPVFAHETKHREVATEHITTLEKFTTDRLKSILDGNPGMLSAYYADNIRLMTESAKTILGKTNVLSYYKALSNRFVVKEYGTSKTEITDLGRQIIETGLFTMTVALKSTGKEHELAGKYLDIWAKSDNGTLSLIAIAWNYDQQLEIADELRFTEVPAVQMAFQAHVPVRDNISFELAALNKLLEAAVAQHDAKVWSQFFADDARLMANQNPLCLGRKAVDDYVENHVKYLPIFEKLDIRNDRIDNLGDYVVEYATHVANWRNGESSGVNTGKNIRIWRREQDCSLKLFLQIGMYD